MNDHLEQGFVQQHSLRIEPLSLPEPIIRIAGNIACRGCIVIMVIKHIRILDEGSNPYVQTQKYSYNAFIANHDSSTFLRHDNAHVHPGHDDEHHWHEFDWKSGDEVDGSPFWCKHDWPTLSQFIDAVSTWYDDHRDGLPDPDGTVEDLAIYDERTALYDPE